MAARLEYPLDPVEPRLTDLRHVRGSDLAPMFSEEIAVWRGALDWDFQSSAELVERFVEMRGLNGYALVAGRQTVGYAYFVIEDHKGLIGDLYVRREFRSERMENALLGACVRSLRSIPGVRRVESQFMLMAYPGGEGIEGAVPTRIFERFFMRLDLTRGLPAKAARLPEVAITQWSERDQEAVAALIARSYQGHIDSLINDQYCSVAGARRFLNNIVQYPGCGTFFGPASFVASDGGPGVCAVALGSLVSLDSGHITQLCVGPEWRGSGLGYEFLRRSIQAFREAGCRSVSLTVTASNENAVKLYQRCGFQIERSFPAFIWEFR